MFISLGHFSCELKYPLFYSIGCLVRGLASQYILNDKIIWSHTLLCSFAELSMGFFILALRIRGNKEDGRITALIQMDKNLIKNKENNKKVLFFIFLVIALTNYIFCFIMFALNEFLFEYAAKILGIPYTFFIVRYFLNKSLGKHRIFSLIVIICCLLPFSIINIIDYVNEEKKPNDFTKDIFFFILSFAIAFIGAIYFPTKHLIEKLIMDNMFINPYSLLFIEGIFNLGINIIMMIFFFFIPCRNDFYMIKCNGNRIFSPEILFKNEIKQYPYLIIYLISTVIVELSVTYTNNHLDPTYVTLFDIFTAFFSFVALIPKYKFSLLDKLKIPIYLIWIFIGLVFNELIIIRKWSLDEDTTSNINNRGIDEYNSDKSSQFLKSSQDKPILPN